MRASEGECALSYNFRHLAKEHYSSKIYHLLNVMCVFEIERNSVRKILKIIFMI